MKNQTARPLPGMTPGEWLRKAAHLAAFVPALLLPWLAPGQALLLAGGLLAMNVFLLPRVLPGLYRPLEPGHGALEVILYPAALLAVLASYGYPASPSAHGGPAWYLVPMGAWFAIACLDACIGIGCRLLRAGPTLPWNPRKPALGVLAGTLAALLAAWALHRGLAAAGLFPALPASAAWTLAGLLALCALAETAWFGITDNLTVPFSFCVLAPLLPSGLLPGGIPEVTWPMLLVPLAFGLVANLGGMLTLAGALLGTAMAFLLMAAEPRLFAFLGGFFALAVGATRFRYAGKAARKVAEARGGKRGAAQVFGAMGAAAWMTPLVHLAEARARAGSAGAEDVRSALLVCAAPFVAKAMDTVSSEMGKAIAGRTVSLRTFRSVPPGSEGAVSLAGTLWGLAAAAALSAPVLLLGWGGPADVLLLVGIAFLANLFESWWGEWSKERGLEDGPQTNFLLTLAAALMAWAVWLRP